MNIPQHIVLFPDGNRRWAKARGIASFEGHQQGYRKIIEFTEWCKNKGIKSIIAFGFSTENWNRSEEEVNYLMMLLESGLLESLERFKNEEVRVRVIGQRERLPESLKKAIRIVEEETKNNEKINLNLAVSYGGKWDILQAINKIIEEKTRALKELSARPSIEFINKFNAPVDENLFEKYLSTAGLPNPDLIIRAGGEMRLSNFVLWQAAYSELYFSSKLWPDFTEEDLNTAINEFDKRVRRFGK